MVDCGKFPDILRAIFDKMLNNGMIAAKNKMNRFIQSDERMKQLSIKLKV